MLDVGFGPSSQAVLVEVANVRTTYFPPSPRLFALYRHTDQGFGVFMLALDLGFVTDFFDDDPDDVQVVVPDVDVIYFVFDLPDRVVE